MKTEIAVAMIAGTVSLLAAGATVMTARRTDANALAIERVKADLDRQRDDAARRRETMRYSEPLVRAAYDLQSRLYNILDGGVIDVFVKNGDERERLYIEDNTAYVIAQYLCWTEAARDEIRFIDLGESGKTRRLQVIQDEITSAWQSDQEGKPFRLFAGEQRALGEALLQKSPAGASCLGYGAFLKTYHAGVDPVVDNLRSDVAALVKNGVPPSRIRLMRLQHALIDLLALLDPDYLRFPADKRTKA